MTAERRDSNDSQALAMTGRPARKPQSALKDYLMSEIITSKIPRTNLLARLHVARLIALVVLLFYVRDTGAGIAESDHQEIFKPFFSAKEDGMGFGLAISTRMIEDQSRQSASPGAEAHLQSGFPALRHAPRNIRSGYDPHR